MTSPRDAGQPAQPAGTVQPAGAAQQPNGAAQQEAGPPRHRALRPTRMGGVWVGLALSAVVLLLLLVFILENEKKVDIAFFGAHGHLPLGVALLLAAVAGALLVLIPGTVRIVQLRRTARRHHAAAQQASSAPPATSDQPPPGGAR
jgi:uncharacterized integral membrane protein